MRVALAALLLAFALSSIAHVTHQHDAATASAAHSIVCGYCASFGSMADAPRHTFESPVDTARADRIVLPVCVLRSIEQRISARPRAPPIP